MTRRNSSPALQWNSLPASPVPASLELIAMRWSWFALKKMSLSPWNTQPEAKSFKLFSKIVPWSGLMSWSKESGSAWIFLPVLAQRGEGRGEEPWFLWLTPHPDPLPVWPGRGKLMSTAYSQFEPERPESGSFGYYIIHQPLFKILSGWFVSHWPWLPILLNSNKILVQQ